MTYSIEIDKTELEFNANSSANNGNTFTVTIDGETKGTGFRYETAGGGWFDLLQESGNTFTVVVRENFNIGDRTGYVILHHNCIKGVDGEKTVMITQKGVNCSVNVEDADKTTLDFSSDVDNKDERSINVKVTGGRKKYYVQSIKQFDSQNRLIRYDRGIKVNKINDSELKITSYGQTFMENGCYYVVTLAHVDDRGKTAEIIVTYSTGHTSHIQASTPSGTNIETLSKSVKVEIQNIQTEEVEMTPYLNLIPISLKTGKQLKSKSSNSDEIVFKHDGETKAYRLERYPENSDISVKISSDFIKYKIENEVLKLIALQNPSIVDRKCSIEIRNVFDVNTIIKTAIQKGG